MSRSKQERVWLDALVGVGCIVCRQQFGQWTNPQIHHIRAGQGMGQRAPDFLAIPLCPEHHTDGGFGVALHAGQATFEASYGSEMKLLADTIALVVRRHLC